MPRSWLCASMKQTMDLTYSRCSYIQHSLNCHALLTGISRATPDQHFPVTLGLKPLAIGFFQLRFGALGPWPAKIQTYIVVKIDPSFI